MSVTWLRWHVPVTVEVDTDAGTVLNVEYGEPVHEHLYAKHPGDDQLAAVRIVREAGILAGIGLE
jgi:hypothetical protein